MERVNRVLRLLSPAFSSGRAWQRYSREIRRPLACLLFLLPWVVLYEAVMERLPGTSGSRRMVLADSMIHTLLEWFGIVGVWVPAVVLVVTLLIWHVWRGDRWRVRWWVLGGMLGESVLLAVPMLVLAAFFSPPRGEVAFSLPVQLARGMGAGIYEELVFRLLLISGLSWLMGEVMGLRGSSRVWVAVGLAAVVFSMCHFQPLTREAFSWRLFWFRLLAGVYLSVVFLGRGLGVSSGAHALHNVVLVWLGSAAEG